MELWWTTLWIHNETRRFLCKGMRITNTFRTSYFASYKVYKKTRKTSNYAQVMPIMPLCKYLHEYVMPEDGFFTIELVLETAFWSTRSLLQKVTLKSSRRHHSLYYRIWQFHETMRIAQEVIPLTDGRHLGTIWYTPTSRRSLCPIDNLKNSDHYVKNRENDQNPITYGDNSDYPWDLFDYQSDSLCVPISQLSHG